MADLVTKEYGTNIGTWIRVNTPTGRHEGILHAADSENIRLLPSIVNESTGFNGGLELRLDKDVPTRIPYPQVISSQPLSSDYVGEMLKKYPVKYNNNQLELSL
ncbi:hypothetical protein K8R47_00545 [archaeon]|nr:hypothetical protein [archaeon]